MGNCLITKLKGSVDNNNIPKMDEFPVYFNNALNVMFGGKYVINYQESPITLRLGDGLTATATGRPHVFAISGTGVLFVPQKEYINVLQCETYDGCTMEFSDLKYLSTLNTLSIIGNCVTMTTSQFNELKSLRAFSSSNLKTLTGSINDFYFQESNLSEFVIGIARNVTGDFKYMGRFRILNNIRITNTGITGSIEDFVAVARGMGGRTTGSVTFLNGSESNITFKGVKCTGTSSSDTIVWTADSITYNGETISNSSVIDSLD